MTRRRLVRVGGTSVPPWQPPHSILSRSLLDAALAYAATGWAVLPVAGMSAGKCGCGKPCESPCKHPISRHGVHDATTDPVLIREWWRRSPRANVGIATGAASGLVVVDLDLPRGGRESLRALLAAGRELPATLRSYTGGRGLHLFYAQPRGMRVPNAVGRLGGISDPLTGIDLRGDGGYVVAPPSLHVSGNRYRWDGGRIMPLPPWVLTPERAMRPQVAERRGISAGASPYGSTALTVQLEGVRGLTPGRRNDGLNRAAFSLGRLVGGGELPEALVYEALIAAAMATGLGEPEAHRTIRSGLTAGKAVPRIAPGFGESGRVKRQIDTSDQPAHRLESED
jgi:hypothetical protein